jgi:hypothetical protein
MSYEFKPFITNQVSVTGVATLIVSANPARREITITQLGTTDVFLGNVSVTISTGDLLTGTKGTSKTYKTTAAIYGVTSGAAQAISYFEVQK